MPSSSPSAIVAEPARAVDPAARGERIRLLLLSDTAVRSAGGSERFLRNLISQLPADRYCITMVQLIESAGIPIHGEEMCEDDDHIRVLRLPMGAIYGRRGWRALRSLRSMLRRERFDIIQSQHEKSDLINALLPRMPGAVHISNRRDMGFNKSSRLRLAFHLLNHRYDCVVAPSQRILSDLAKHEGIPAQRMLWIPNGVDVDHFRPRTEQEKASCRRQLDLDNGDIVFGCVASLTPVKCHEDLVSAFAKVYEDHPNARLLLIGDGPLRARITAMIEGLGLGSVVRLLGNRADVAQALGACDAMVLASSTEGMSNAVLEAMACGLPIVATAVGGNPHLVQQDVTGLLVPAHAPAALATALGVLAGAPDMRRRMGQAARQRTEKTLCLDGMVQAFDHLYRRLLRR